MSANHRMLLRDETMIPAGALWDMFAVRMHDGTQKTKLSQQSNGENVTLSRDETLLLLKCEIQTEVKKISL